MMLMKPDESRKTGEQRTHQRALLSRCALSRYLHELSCSDVRNGDERRAAILLSALGYFDDVDSPIGILTFQDFFGMSMKTCQKSLLDNISSQCKDCERLPYCPSGKVVVNASGAQSGSGQAP